MPAISGEPVGSPGRVAAHGIGGKIPAPISPIAQTPTSNGPQVEPFPGRSPRQRPTAKPSVVRPANMKLAVCVHPESPRAS